MFGYSKADQLNKAHGELLEKVISLSHENGSLTAENKSLAREIEDKADEVLALKSQIKEMQSNQDKMMKVASALGVNIDFVIHGDVDLYLARAISLAGIYIKSEILKKGIPSFEDARKTEYMKDFILALPGFESSSENNDENTEAKKQYDYIRNSALCLFSTE